MSQAADARHPGGDPTMPTAAVRAVDQALSAALTGESPETREPSRPARRRPGATPDLHLRPSRLRQVDLGRTMGGQPGIADGVGDAGGGGQRSEILFRPRRRRVASHRPRTRRRCRLAARRGRNASCRGGDVPLIADLSAAKRPFVLVLDDYQAIAVPELHQAIERLLRQPPPAMRLVLISRTMPPLRLARLEFSGELLVVTQADLQFTPEETRQYFHDCLNLDLTPSEVALLRETSEGWAIGLQLLGSALQGLSRDDTENSSRTWQAAPT